VPSTASRFPNIQIYEGSSYTDKTLEAATPLGTAFTALGTTSGDYAYIGSNTRFDMVIFDLNAASSVTSVAWEYHDGTAWVQFAPLSGSLRYADDGQDNELIDYDFSGDGVELFPSNIMPDWSTTTVNSVSRYWVRVSGTVTSVITAYSIKIRPVTYYASSKDVFDMIQLGEISGTSDFTENTIPTKLSVEQFIQEAQGEIDFQTQKSWRPTFVTGEYHDWNLNGVKLENPSPSKVLKLQIWTGSTWATKTQGRRSDYFFVPTTGMIHFSRFFIMPASLHAPMWRWGGGEFKMPIKVEYLAGNEVDSDNRQGPMVHAITKWLAAANVLRNLDFGLYTVSGTDKVPIAQKVADYETKASDMMERLRGFESF